jgi:hypothetical protein
VDGACLSLYITLLDYTLKGDLFESAIVGFLAVVGINFEKETLIEAYVYTPFLSAFVKVGPNISGSECGAGRGKRPMR